MLTGVGYFGNWDLWQNYHKVTFDGLNKLIRVNEGVTTLDIKTDVYSDWKEWVSTRDDNAFWLPAIRSIGGDPTVAGQTAGDIYFLINGWKLYIDLTKVAVTGVLFSDDFTTAYYDFNGNAQFPAQVSSLVSGISATSGATPAEVWTYSDRSLTQAVSASAPTTAEIAQAVWEYLTRTLTESSGTSPQEIWSYSSRTLTTTEAPSASATAAAVWNAANASYNTVGTFGHLLNEIDYLEKQIWVNTDLGVNGSGSQESPFNNINDAIDKAETDGIYVIDLIGDITLNRNFKNFKLKGIGNPQINLNGQNTKNSTFCNVKVKGAFQDGSGCLFEDCEILDTASLEGTYDNCALLGDLTCQDTATVLMKDCVSGIAGTGRPTISMNATGTSLLSVRGYSGGLTIKDCNNAADRVTIELHPGSLTFDSSNTNGIMVARGVGHFVDSTAGATVFNETVNQSITDEVENSVSAVQTTVNTINTNLSTVDGLVRTVDTVVDGIAVDLATVDTNVDTINTNLNTANANINTIDTNVDNLTNDVNTINNNLIIVDNVVDSISNDVGNVLTDLASISANVAAIDVNLDTSTISSNILAVQASVNAINTDSLSADIAAVQASVNAINTDSLSAEIAAVQASVNAINTDSLSAEIAAVQASVDAIDTTSLSANIAAVSTKLDGVEAKVDTIDTNVDDIEAKVLELWRLAGLDAANVQSITDTSITVGGITITIGNPDNNTTTLTRS